MLLSIFEMVKKIASRTHKRLRKTEVMETYRAISPLVLSERICMHDQRMTGSEPLRLRDPF